MKVLMKGLLLILGLTVSMTGTAAAPPTDGGKPPPAEKPSAEADSGAQLGLTIVGDRETPLGLFITPWKNAYAPERRDRPALLLDEAPLPVDPDTFRRQVSYGEAFAAYSKSAPLNPAP